MALILLELPNEPVVGVHLPALPLERLYGLAGRQIVLLHQVGGQDRGAPGDSRHAVNQDVAVLAGLFDEVEGLVKIAGDVFRFGILQVDVLVVVHLLGDLVRDLVHADGEQAPDPVALQIVEVA